MKVEALETLRRAGFLNHTGFCTCLDKGLGKVMVWGAGLAIVVFFAGLAIWGRNRSLGVFSFLLVIWGHFVG